MLVPADTVLKHDWDATVDALSESISLLFFISNFPITPTATCQNLPPCFSSLPQTLLPFYDTHQLDNLGFALTVINTLLTDPSCQKNVTSQSQMPKFVSKKHNNTRIRGKRDQRNQMARTTSVPYLPIPFLPQHPQRSPTSSIPRISGRCSIPHQPNNH